MLNVEVTVCESSSSLRGIRKKAQAYYRLYPQTSCSIRQHSHNRVADKIFQEIWYKRICNLCRLSKRSVDPLFGFQKSRSGYYILDRKDAISNRRRNKKNTIPP